MPNGGYGWHQHLGGGPGSLLGLVGPLLLVVLLFVLLAAASSARGRFDAYLSRRKSSATPLPMVTKDTHARSRVLASDRERDEAARVVAHAVGEGRLSLEEGDQRIEAVLTSRHRHELGGLVSDLPSPPAASARRQVAEPLSLGPLALAALVILAAAVVQAVVGLWELWPLAVVVLGVSALLPAVRQRAQRLLPPSDW
jgi:hypothetical protein